MPSLQKPNKELSKWGFKHPNSTKGKPCPKKEAVLKTARKAVLEASRKAASKASREASRKAKRSALLEAAHYKKEHEFLFYHVMDNLNDWGEIDITEKRKNFYLPHYLSFQVKVLNGLEAKMEELFGKDLSKSLFSFLSPSWRQNIDLRVPSQLTCSCVCVKKKLTLQIFYSWSHFHQLRCYGNCDCRFSNSICFCDAIPECNCSAAYYERCDCFDDEESDRYKNRFPDDEFDY